MRKRLVWSLLAGVLSLLASAGTWAQNIVQAENAKPGTVAWRLTAPAKVPTVVGYASHTSVNRGETIRFFISTAAPSYTLEIFRVGWYGGAGGRQMLSTTLPGLQQPTPTPDPATGMVECQWAESFRVTIPQTADRTDWASGMYLAKLTPSGTGTQSYIHFVVRDDASTATYLMQSTATTWQAYNNWGGKSLYGYNSTGGQARKVSFNRPYANDGYWGGAGHFFNWEINFVRFLEREGYDVTYVSNLDLHATGTRLLRHRALLVAGHDEYWSYEMKSAVHAAQAQGVHLGFFGANQTYWQVRFEPGGDGTPLRTMVGYKEAAQFQDPLALDADRANDRYITARFRDLAPVFGVNDPVALPENGLVGVMYHGDPVNGDMVVHDPLSWVFSGTGVSVGSRFTGLLGYEADTIFNNGHSPPQLRKVTESPDPWGFSHATTYTASSGSVAFATGSMQWHWGLDNHGGRNLENAAVKQATRNVLGRLGAAPVRMPTGLQATSGPQQITLSWGSVAGATSYNLFRSTTAGTLGSTPYRAGLASPGFNDTALAAGTYHYRVSAASATAESAQSVEIAASPGSDITEPPPPPPPPPPPALAVPAPPSALAASTTRQAIRLSWTQSNGASLTANKVYRSTSASGPFSLVATVSPTTAYTDDRVARRTAYHYAVTAVNDAGESAYSNTVRQTSK